MVARLVEFEIVATVSGCREFRPTDFCLLPLYLKYPEANLRSIVGHKSYIANLGLMITIEKQEELGFPIHRFIMHTSLMSCPKYQAGSRLQIRTSLSAADAALLPPDVGEMS